MGVVTEFLLDKYSLTEEDITKAFRSCNRFLQWKSVQNCEEVLELLNGYGLTTPTQIRKVTLYCPKVFFYRSAINIMSKLSFFRTFMKEKDIAKLLYSDARVLTHSEDGLKSAVSLLRNLGLEGEAVSELLTRAPRFLTASEKEVMESFQNAKDLGLEKGSKIFAYALRAILGKGKEKLDRRVLCFSNLGFSENQISEILRRQPVVLSLTEERVKRNADFLVHSVGLSLDDLVQYPDMFLYSLDKNLIPRYRVLETLKAMQMLKTERKFPTIFKWTKKRFLEEYVHLNAESSSVLRDIYHGGKADH